MSNELSIAMMDLMKKVIRLKLEECIAETEKSIDKAIKQLKEMDEDV